MLPFIDRNVSAPIYWSQYVCPNLLIGIFIPPFIGRNMYTPIYWSQYVCPHLMAAILCPHLLVGICMPSRMFLMYNI